VAIAAYKEGRGQTERDLLADEEIAEGREGEDAVALRLLARRVAQPVAVHVEKHRRQIEEEEEQEEERHVTKETHPHGNPLSQRAVGDEG